METAIIWNKSGDDYTAKVGEYQIRIRQGKNDCYWALTKPLHEVSSYAFVNSAFADTLEAAKTAAEQAYLKHINK